MPRGYRAKRVLVPFDRDRDVTIVLDPLPTQPPRIRLGKRRPASEEPSVFAPIEALPTVELLPGAKLPTRQRIQTNIDTDDPYAN